MKKTTTKLPGLTWSDVIAQEHDELLGESGEWKNAQDLMAEFALGPDAVRRRMEKLVRSGVVETKMGRKKVGSVPQRFWRIVQ